MSALKNVTREVRESAGYLLARYRSAPIDASSTNRITHNSGHIESSNRLACGSAAAGGQARHDPSEAEVDVLIAVAAAALQKLQEYCANHAHDEDESGTDAVVDCADEVNRTRRALVHCLKSHRRRRAREEADGTDTTQEAPRHTMQRARGDPSDTADSSAACSERAAAGVSVDVDLGQYANTHAFDGNAKKLTRFARLMGGAKPSTAHHTHTTQAASSECMLAINKNLESQFDTAREHKGKKGLGA